MAGRGTNSIQAFNKESFKEILMAFDSLPKEFSSRRKQTIAKKGMSPFVESAKNKAKQDTGALKLSIGTKTFRNNKNGAFGGVILKQKGNSESETTDAFYAKFLEYGWTHIAWPQKGQSIKKGTVYKKQMSEVPAERNAFLRPAWDETRMRVQSETIKLIEKRLAAYMRKVKVS